MDVRTLLEVMVEQEASDLYLTVDRPTRLSDSWLDPRTDAASVHQRATRVAGAGDYARPATEANSKRKWK